MSDTATKKTPKQKAAQDKSSWRVWMWKQVKSSDDYKDVMRLKRWVHAWDAKWSAKIHNTALGPFDYLLLIPAMACGTYGMGVMLFVLYFLTGLKFVAFIGISALLTVTLTNYLKRAFSRDRPEHAKLGKRAFNLRSLLNNHAFPSGDSAQSAVIATAILLYPHLHFHNVLPEHALPTPFYAYVAFVPLVMYSRVYYGAHWICDTIGGVVIGACVTYVAFLGVEYGGVLEWIETKQ